MKDTKMYMILGIDKDDTLVISDDLFDSLDKAREVKEIIWRVLGGKYKYKWIGIKEMYVL